MTTDLSVCQTALARDPVLYLDLTEAIRRGDGKVLGATPHGALAAFTNLIDGPQFGFTMFADNLETAEQLLELLPPVPGFITVHETLYAGLLQERFGFTGLRPCWQVGYLRAAPLPLPELGVEVRQLDASHLPTVISNYDLEDEEYLDWLIGRGELFGAFDGDTLMAFAGRHAEGSIGLLEVLPQYRRRGLATLLQSHMINLELSRGHIPYGQVFDGNEPSLALQRSLGMTKSIGQLAWAVRDS
ncbi:MAG: GNAT family N-acetyltransferase [Clostridiales bacterium]|nr:GNAT family N-acetyltransferase [Clostridiales bacterium]